MTLRIQGDALTADVTARRGALGEADDMATRSTIHWQCQAASHLALHSRHGNGGLTIYERAWAYCDGAGADDAHEWKETGGAPLELLVRWTAPNGVSTDDERPLVVASRSNGHPKLLRKTAGARRT